jgi:hypothetical protein
MVAVRVVAELAQHPRTLPTRFVQVNGPSGGLALSTAIRPWGILGAAAPLAARLADNR